MGNDDLMRAASLARDAIDKYRLASAEVASAIYRGHITVPKHIADGVYSRAKTVFDEGSEVIRLLWESKTTKKGICLSALHTLSQMRDDARYIVDTTKAYAMNMPESINIPLCIARQYIKEGNNRLREVNSILKRDKSLLRSWC